MLAYLTPPEEMQKVFVGHQPTPSTLKKFIRNYRVNAIALRFELRHRIYHIV